MWIVHMPITIEGFITRRSRLVCIDVYGSRVGLYGWIFDGLGRLVMLIVVRVLSFYVAGYEA